MTIKKITYFLVEEFGKTERMTSRDERPVNGIMKLHSLMAQDDKVILLPWTCTSYIVSVICLECKGRKEFLKLSDISPGNDDDLIVTNKIKQQNTDDEGQTDVENDEKSGDKDEEDDITAGGVVWRMCGRMWYPAKVCSLTNVPENMRNLFHND